jgi:hypothetical protein
MPPSTRGALPTRSMYPTSLLRNVSWLLLIYLTTVHSIQVAEVLEEEAEETIQVAEAVAEEEAAQVEEAPLRGHMVTDSTVGLLD